MYINQHSRIVSQWRSAWSAYDEHQSNGGLQHHGIPPSIRTIFIGSRLSKDTPMWRKESVGKRLRVHESAVQRSADTAPSRKRSWLRCVSILCTQHEQMCGEEDLGSQEVCTKRCKRIFSNSLTSYQALMEIQKVKLSTRISWTGINFQNILLILITEGSPLWCEFKVIF